MYDLSNRSVSSDLEWPQISRSRCNIYDCRCPQRIVCAADARSVGDISSCCNTSHSTDSRRSGMDHSFTCKLHHTCLYLISFHQMALPLTCEGVHLITAYYSSIDLERMKGWVGLVGWTSGRFTLVSGHPSASGKVRRSKTDVLPLCHATNRVGIVFINYVSLLENVH